MTMALHWKVEGVSIEYIDDKVRRGKINIFSLIEIRVLKSKDQERCQTSSGWSRKFRSQRIVLGLYYQNKLIKSNYTELKFLIEECRTLQSHENSEQ